MSSGEGDGKAPLDGLVDMGNISFYNDPGSPTPTLGLLDMQRFAASLGGIVVNVTWAQLQASEDGTITTKDNPIDHALGAVAAFNLAHHTDLGIKLRVWGGYVAPDWAKNIDGPAITVTAPPFLGANPVTETVGRFWTSDYIAAWTSFQEELAAKYDGNPLIREVAITSGALASDEPFVPLLDGYYSPLLQAGYSDAAEERVLSGAITDYAAWSTTPLDFTFNMFHQEDSGSPQGDPAFTLAVMQAALGSSHKTVLSNHALNTSSSADPADAFVYQQIMNDLALDPAGTTTDFQTASPVRLGGAANWPLAVENGVSHGASNIELWPDFGGYTTIETPASMAQLAAILAAGVAPPEQAPPDGGALMVIAPADATAASGTSVAFTGYQAVTVASTLGAGDTYTVTVQSVSGLGALSANDANGTVSGNGSSILTITGTLDAVNSALAGLAETLPSGTQADTLTVTVDAGSDSASQSLGVTLLPAAGPGATQSASDAPVVAAGTGETYHWVGGTADTNYQDPANWSPAGSPGSLDTAVFDLAQATVSGSGTAGALVVLGPVVVTGSLLAVGLGPAPAVEVNQGGTRAGSLDLAAGATLTAGSLVVGGAGQGTLHAGGEGGAPADLTSAGVSLGDAAGSDGVLALDGASWTDTGSVTVGGLGSAALILDGGAQATIAGDVDLGTTQGTLHGTGLALIDGANTDVTIEGNLVIGSTGTGDSGLLLAALGPLAQDTARLVVAGTLDVGGNGTLALTGAMSAGAAAIAAGGVVSGNGTLTVGGTILNDGTIGVVADAALGVAQLTLDAAVAGDGTLSVGAGATLTLAGVVDAGQVVAFAPNTQAQFSTAPTPASALVLDAPAAMKGTITGFSFADALVLQGVTATGTLAYANNVLTVPVLAGTAGTVQLSFTLDGALAGEMPVATVADGATTIRFVSTSPAGQAPAVLAPSALHDVNGETVPVPDIVLLTPGPAITPPNGTVLVTVTAGNGTLDAGNDEGNTTLIGQDTGQLLLAGSLAAVERSLASLTYTAGATGNDAITVTVSDYFAVSPAPSTTIDVTNTPAALDVGWGGGNGAFQNTGDWTGGTVPGGADAATFGAGFYTVSGDGAAGQLIVNGTVTLTGTVQALGMVGTLGTVQSVPTAALIDSGDLILRTGAALAADANVDVGVTQGGTLTLMDGSATIGTGTTGELAIGLDAGSSGSVIVSSSLQVAGSLTVGASGQGTLRLSDVAAMASDTEATIGADSGATGAAIVDAGMWSTTETLTIGGAGTGSLLIDGDANGHEGEVSDLSAVIAAASGSSGRVDVEGGNWLSLGTLAIGQGGNGTLEIGAGGAVGIGVNGNPATTLGLISVGAVTDGSGLVAIGDGGSLTGVADMAVGTVGTGRVEVGLTPGDDGHVAVSGVFTVGANGSVQIEGSLAGPDASAGLNAGSFQIDARGVISGSGALGGLANGSGVYALAPIANDGTIAAEGGTLLLYGNVTGTGVLEVAAGATLTVQGSVASGQTVDFAANAGLLTLDAPVAFDGTVEGFAPGDTLDLVGVQTTEVSSSDQTLTLSTPSQDVSIRFASDVGSDFLVQADQHGGTLVQLACFARGTRIATPSGEVPIEDLRAGDPVLTARGVARPIRWIGHRRVACARHPTPLQVLPIRIAAHAFGPDMPRRDLLLSPDHAIFAEDVFIPAKLLVNGSTIRRMAVREITYFHLELDTHDVVHAEGLPTESYLDTGNRRAFSDADPTLLHPVFRWDGETGTLAWEAEAAAPLRVTGEQVDRVRSVLAARAQRARLANGVPQERAAAGAA